MLAAFTKIPELELDHAESEKLAAAIGEVSDHYGLAAAFDPRTVAWVNLVQVSVAVYGSRIATLRLKAAAAKADAAAARANEPQVKTNTTTNNAPRETLEKIPGFTPVVVPQPNFNNGN